MSQRASAANGVGRRRSEKEASRSDNQNWRQPARTTPNSSTQGVLNHVTMGGGGPRSGENMITRGKAVSFYTLMCSFCHSLLLRTYLSFTKTILVHRRMCSLDLSSEDIHTVCF